MQLLCFLFAVRLLTRVARLTQTLVKTNKILTSIDTKLDNLSTDTKKMFDGLDKMFDTKVDTPFDKLDKKLGHCWCDAEN